MLESADAFAAMENDTKAAALAQEVFGKAGTDLLPLLKLGREGIEGLTDQAGELGFVMSGETADASADFNDALNEMKSTMGGAVQQIGSALIPALNEIVDKITPVISGISKWVGENPKLVKTVAAISAIILGAGGLLIAVGGILTIIGPVIAILSGPVGLALAIGAFIGILGTLIAKTAVVRAAFRKIGGAFTFLQRQAWVRR